MNFKIVNRDLRIGSLAQQKLSIINRSIVSGSSNTLFTPLSKDKDVKSILDKFDEVFNLSSNRSKINDELYSIEMSNRDKFGPRSIAAPWKVRRDSVLRYFEPAEPVSDSLLFYPQNSRDKGILRPISLNNAVSYLKNSTNSGLPFLVRKSEVKSVVVSDFNELLRRMDPCVLFTRTQEGGKTRNVWGYPVADTTNEMMYYRPLLDYQRKLDWRAALIGPDHVDLSITKLINNALILGHLLLSMDFSEFDIHSKKFVQQPAFSYIKYLFQDQFSQQLDYIYHRFNTIGLITPEGVFTGEHGVPSGSTFTNEVDSIIQYLVAKASHCVFPENMQIQGDDGAYAVYKRSVDEVFESFKRFRLNVNTDKSHLSDKFVTYLQKLYHIDYRDNNGIIRGIYPVYRALNRLLFQERWTNFEEFGIEGKDYYSIRAISILENCKHHPLFKELVKFILNLDKYSLEYSQNGLRKYIDMLSDSKGIEGVLINQYGDDLRGIGSFATVRLIRELR